jgi:AhpD family alkylhydroperoxidase
MRSRTRHFLSLNFATERRLRRSSAAGFDPGQMPVSACVLFVLPALMGADWPAARVFCRGTLNRRAAPISPPAERRLPATTKAGDQVSTDYQARIAELDEYAIELRKLIPDTVAAFGALSKAAQAPGELDKKTKELIALAIAVAMRCDGCVAYHARGAHRAGATRQELAEMLGVAVQMGGGPSLNYGADALRAFDQFEMAALV